MGMLLEVGFAGLSPWVFWAGVGVMALGFALGEASWMAWVLLYPWWRLGQGWRLRLFPDHLSLHPPLGPGRRIPWEEVREVGVGGPSPGEGGPWSSAWRTGRGYPFPCPILRAWRPGSKNF